MLAYGTNRVRPRGIGIGPALVCFVLALALSSGCSPQDPAEDSAGHAVDSTPSSPSISPPVECAEFEADVRLKKILLDASKDHFDNSRNVYDQDENENRSAKLDAYLNAKQRVQDAHESLAEARAELKACNSNLND